MNLTFITPIILLAILSTAAYFYGTKKNRWLASILSRQAEEVFKPTNTNYVNIGGAIGYNFTYTLPAPYTNAKGTMTLSPRHSLLYLPFSLLLGMRDRYFINLFTKAKFLGEAHLITDAYLRKTTIEGLESMERGEVRKGNKRFILLWRGAKLESELEKILDAIPDPSMLRHFCAYPETKTFYIHVTPKNGDIKNLLEAIYVRLPLFLAKPTAKQS
jgi:hypothetical protein